MPARLPFRFGLRTLLVGIAVLGLLLAPFTWRVHRARAQADLVKRLEAAGVMVYYDFEIETEGSRYVLPSVSSGGNIPFDRGAWKDFFCTSRGLQTPMGPDLQPAENRARAAALFDEALSDGPAWWELRVFEIALPTERLTLITRQNELIELEFRNVDFPNRDLSSLEKLQNLRRLEFQGVKLEECRLPNFASLPRLRSLILCDATAAQLEQVTPAAQINDLWVVGLKEGVDDCRWLQTFPDLMTLLLFDADSFSDADFQYLETMEHLEWLKIDSQRLTGEKIDGSRLPNIGELDLAESSLVSGKWLAEMRMLRVLDLSNTKLSQDALAEIDWPASLETIDLQGLTVDERTFEKLARMDQLRVISLSPKLVEPWLIERFEELKPNCRVHVEAQLDR